MEISSMAEIEQLLSQEAPKARGLHEAWKQRRPIAKPDEKKSHYGLSDSLGVPWLDDAALARKFVSLALRAEEFLLAIDAAREILFGWETSSRDNLTNLVYVRMDHAKALTRIGFTEAARNELAPCMEPGLWPMLGSTLKIEVLLQLGNILREESYRVSARTAQLTNAEEALGFYRQALEIDPKRLDALVFSASLAFVLGGTGDALRAQAQQAAHHILELTGRLQDDEVVNRETIWAQASAHAVIGNLQQAHAHFERLQHVPRISTAYLAEVRFQAQFLAEAQDKPRNFFKSAFPALELIVFAGHLPDLAQQPDNPGTPGRLPAAAIPAARESLRAKLREMGARVGLASASAGADLLFTEALEDFGCTLHVVLPWSQDEFLRTSVLPFETDAANPRWKPLFDRALAAAATTREIGQVFEPGSDIGWEFMMEVTAGIALQTARTLRLDLKPLVLWDGLPGRGVGGTSSFYDFWKHKMGIEPIVVRPPALPDAVQAGGSAIHIQRCESSIVHQEVKSMLFADIVGYSKLTEKVIPAYIDTFLKRLGQLAATSKHAPCCVNTWGDALYAVFDYAQDAGLFALEVTQMIQEGKDDWLSKGLYSETRSSKDGTVEKHPLSVRIGLHTGPVVMHYDPIVRRIGLTGAHVNRAARIEPVADAGQVFASEEFAAMVELNVEVARRGSGASGSAAESGVVCEYAGSMQLAKGYPGRHRIYRVVKKRTRVLESLARAVHEDFCAASGGRAPTVPVLCFPGKT